MVETKTAGTQEDRRKYPRLDRIIKMRYQRVESLSEKSPYLEGDLLDVSSGGLRFLASQPLEIKSQLVIILEYPGWLNTDNNHLVPSEEGEPGVLQAMGEVLRVQASQTDPGKFEVGVQFSEQLQGK
jgi:c-di-GMP-binding flagellar brake protein YcgR